MDRPLNRLTVGDRQADRRTGRCMDGEKDGWTHRCMDRQMNGQTDGWAHRWSDRQMETDRQKDGQTDSCTVRRMDVREGT